MQVVPRRDPPVLLVVAEAGIDHDAPRRRLHHEAVDAHAQPAILVGEMRPQPGDRQHCLARRLGQDEAAAAGHLELDDLGHRHVADPPLHCRLPPCAYPFRRITIDADAGGDPRGPAAEGASRMVSGKARSRRLGAGGSSQGRLQRPAQAPFHARAHFRTQPSLRPHAFLTIHPHRAAFFPREATVEAPSVIPRRPSAAFPQDR